MLSNWTKWAWNSAFWVFLLGLSALPLRAQTGQPKVDFDRYSGLMCEGELPSDFKETPVEKARKAESEVWNKELERDERLQEKEHAVRSVFGVDEILMSGRVLYGDPLSTFVESVAEKLLKANDREDLLNELRFYVLKSQEVNAYATSNGVVMVTVGLLSRIENESQLAFILAHEIQHYTQKHSLQQYKQRFEQNKQKGKRDEDEAIKAFYKFSKDHEMEADEKGFQMMLRSGYDLVEGV
ncbi:MAG: M48 family metallopeptidase, partial [Bacteroidota bacterium]